MQLKLTPLPLTLLILPAATKAALFGEALITVEDYPVFGPNVPHNPPFCGMSYNSLDLNRITAVQGLPMSSCGACLEVRGDSGCAHVMAVDRGGMGLELSTGISKQAIGNDDGRGWAKWREVSDSMCNGIWNGKMYGDVESTPLATVYSAVPPIKAVQPDYATAVHEQSVSLELVNFDVPTTLVQQRTSAPTAPAIDVGITISGASSQVTNAAISVSPLAGTSTLSSATSSTSISSGCNLSPSSTLTALYPTMSAVVPLSNSSARVSLSGRLYMPSMPSNSSFD